MYSCPDGAISSAMVGAERVHESSLRMRAMAPSAAALGQHELGAADERAFTHGTASLSGAGVHSTSAAQSCTNDCRHSVGWRAPPPPAAGLRNAGDASISAALSNGWADQQQCWTRASETHRLRRGRPWVRPKTPSS